MHTCMTTTPVPTNGTGIQFTACEVSTVLVFTQMWPEIKCQESWVDWNQRKFCLCDKYQCIVIFLVLQACPQIVK